MNIKSLVGISALAVLLAACESGDINVDARTTDNSVSNSNNTSNTDGGSTDENPCASYTYQGSTLQGDFDGTNCEYDISFAAKNTPVLANVSFAALENGGVHLFDDSLIMGRSYTDTATMNAAGITQGGDGPILEIEAGATLVFTEGNFININRGSQIMAVGTQANPITLTGKDDYDGLLSSPEDDQAWGGVIINGFAVNNNCSYTGNRGEAGFASDSECSNIFEGTEGLLDIRSGGDNDADNSGRMEYVIVKHAGSEVAPGKEVNGVTFNSVGSGTVVNYLEVYSSYDDGIEFFGGAMDLNYYVAVYVRDDSIDVDEGYNGTIDHALVVQSAQDGNHCVESDGLGGYGDGGEAAKIAQGLNSAATIKNLTCIISPNETGTHDPGAGLRIREAHFATIQNAIVTTAYAADGIANDDDGNYCVRIESTEGLQAAVDGDLVFEQSAIACQDLTKGDDLPDSQTQLAFLQASNAVYQTAEAGQDPSSADEPNIQLLNGFYSLPLADMVVDGNTISVTPTESRAYIGAVVESNDWTAGWTYGLHADNRGQALWFE